MRSFIAALAFFAFAGPASAQPDTTITAPPAAVTSLGSLQGGSTTGAGTISAVQLRVQDSISLMYWNEGTGAFDLPPAPILGWFNATAQDGTFDSNDENWTNTSFAASLGTTAPPEGVFILEAKAVDDSLQEDGTPETLTFAVDTSAPLSSVDSPAHGTKSMAPFTALSGAAADFISGVAGVQVRVQDMTNSQYWNGTTGWTGTETWVNTTFSNIPFPNWTKTFGATLTSGTTYQIVSKATDTAGNIQVVFDIGFASNTFLYSNAPPSTASVTGLTATTASASWAMVSGSTGYHLVAAVTNTNPPTTFVSAATTVSSATTNATLTGLSANTTYFFFVRAQGPAAATPYSLFATSATTANAPTAPANAGVTSASYSVSWNANSNGAGTAYTAELATTAGFSSPTSSVTLNTSATFSGLAANTTYFARVKVVGHSGVSTAYTTTVSSATDPAAPTGSAATSTGSSQAALSWTANGNPAGTRYTAQLATVSNFSVVQASSQTLNTTATFVSLNPAATFYLRVRADGHNGGSSAFDTFQSTVTAPLSAPSDAALTTLGINSATAGWTLVPVATGYTLLVSTEAVNPPVAAAATTAVGNVNTASATGLSANTTYFFFIRTLGPGVASGYVQFTTTVTLAAAPSATAKAGVTTTAASVSWAANGNPAGTLYEAQAAISAGFSSIAASSVTRNTAATIAALAQNTTYFIRVRAVSHSGINTAFDAAVSSATDAAVPTSPAASSAGSSQATLTWSANANPAGTRYTADLATVSNFSVIQASSQTLLTSAVFNSLNPSSTFYLRVRADGHNGSATAYTVTQSTVTGPLSAPADAAVTAVAVGSITAGWTLVPGATGYLLQASLSATNPPSVIESAIEVGNTNTATTPGLGPNTTYFLFIGSLGPAVKTAYIQFATTVTLADVPGASVATGVTGTSLSLSWTAGTNPAGTLYEAQSSASAGFSSPATSATYNTSTSFTGLTVNTTYYLRVRAVNLAGTAGAFNTAISTATDALIPVTPSAVGDSSVQITLSWGANGNPTGTLYAAEAALDAGFSAVAASSSTRNTSASIAGLTSATTYFLRVKTVGHNGSATAYTSTVSTVTAAVPPDSLSGTVTATPALTGINLVEVALYNASGVQEGSTVRTNALGQWAFTGLTTAASHKIVATYTLNGVASSIYQSGHITGESGIAMAVQLNVTLGSIFGTLRVAAGAVRAAGFAPASAAGAYVEIYQGGRLAGTAQADAAGNFSVTNLLPGRYELRSFDGASFGPMTGVDVAAGQRVAVAFAADLLPKDKVYFYPNPARTSAVIRLDSAVPAVQASASIFDVTGALVRQFAGADAAHAGTELSWTWDLANSNGRAVASGVYLVQVTAVDPSTGRRATVTKKLAVVR